jgi:hypothetical protein
MVVVSDVKVGARLALAGGVTAEVIENMGDGEWLKVRLLDLAGGSGETGTVELCHATDVERVL